MVGTVNTTLRKRTIALACAKEAKEKIKSAEKEIKKLEAGKQTKISQKTEQETLLTTKKKNAEKKTWEIKINWKGCFYLYR
jgi:hypothetical protein